MIDYYLENKNSEWKYTDICIEYAYLENWQRNLRCIFDTVFFGDVSKYFISYGFRACSEKADQGFLSRNQLCSQRCGTTVFKRY